MEPPAAGTRRFIETLLTKQFLKPEPFVDYKHGEDVNGFNLSREGFCKPIVCRKKDGLRMQIPPPNFSLRDVVKYSSPSIPIDVIDVALQTDMQLPLGEFVDLFLRRPRERILNVLSFEHSHTRLSHLVRPPHVVKELSLVDNCWPECTDKEDDEEDASDRPNVQKYCLMSMGNSYTDFHIDFGGSSVWYHLLWGEKIFYVVPPTETNLDAYWAWHALHDNRRIFYPDTLPPLNKTEEGNKLPVARLHLRAGETILLPAGWIHAVYTPCDSLVFGGNFLTQLAIPLQLSVYRMEKKCNTSQRFLFPYFEKLHWYAADVILGRLINDLESNQTPTSYELCGANWLIKFLPRWLKRSNCLPASERCYFLPARCYLQYTWSTLIDKLDRAVQSLTAKARAAKRKKPISSTSHLPLKRHRSVSNPSDRSGSTSPQCSDFILSPQYSSKETSHCLIADDHCSLSSFRSEVNTTDYRPEPQKSRLKRDQYFPQVSEHHPEEEKAMKKKRKKSTNRQPKPHRIPNKRDPDPPWSMHLSSRKRSKRSKSRCLPKKRPIYVTADPVISYSSDEGNLKKN